MMGKGYISASLLVLALLTVAVRCPAQKGEDGSSVDRLAFVRQTRALLRVGVKSSEVVSHWEKLGWPKAIKDVDFVLIRDAGAGPALLKKLKELLQGNTLLSELATRFAPFEVKLKGGAKLSLLRPRSWHQVTSSREERYTFYEHATKLPGWFRRDSLFVWVFDAGAWRSHNEEALTGILLSAARRRLLRAGLLVGPLKDSRLIIKETSQEFPVVEAVCRDPRDKLKGVIAMSALVDEDSSRMIVMGYMARLDLKGEKKTGKLDCRQLLAQMLSSVRIKRPRR